MRALIALEDGSVFSGRAFASHRGVGGEVVFNTSMSGYQEILTDPSYHGQIVVFTAPHLGNYGIHAGESESARVQVSGVITREACEIPSHPGSSQDLPSFLKAQGIFGLTDVDTRALTLRIRSRGTMRGWLTTEVSDPEDASARAREVPPMSQIEAVPAVSTQAFYQWHEVASEFGEGAASGGTSGRFGAAGDAGGVHGPGASNAAGAGGRIAAQNGGRNGGPRIAVLDCGVKFNILRELSARGCVVSVLPADTDAAAIERLSPDGVVLSNGPGDPSALKAWLPRIGRLLTRYPTLAICLGHQVASLALGCRIVKLPFGHHGGNHPVKDLRTGQVMITSQNHNYAVDPSGLPGDLRVTHLNLNDGTVEGLAHESLPLWSLQYHPEASPGPHEAVATFDDFVAAVRRH